MEYISFGKYSEMNTFIHNIHPKSKVISFFALILVASVIPHIKGAVFLFAVACFSILLSRLPLKYVVKRLYMPVILIIFMFLILIVSYTGEPIYSIGSLYMTKEGIDFSTLILFRATSCLFFAFVLYETTRFEKIIHVLYSFKIPEILLQILVLSHRYIYVLLNELTGMLNAAVSKGFNIKLNVKSLTAIGNMIGMLIVKSYERGERVYYAMASKGYTGYIKMSDLEKIKTKDILFIIFSFLIIIFAFLFEIIN